MENYIDADGFDTGVSKEEFARLLRKDLAFAVGRIDDMVGDAYCIMSDWEDFGENMPDIAHELNVVDIAVSNLFQKLNELGFNLTKGM